MPQAVRLIFLALLFAVLPLQAADLNATYSPTRGEWLRVTLLSSIQEQSNLWRERVAVVVLIDAKENTASVSITLANGQPEPSPALKERYVQAVRAIAAGILERHSWAKDVKLLVQFV
ncbi:hypothetical protein [Piscinibacter gummiphilus]|uniref:Curli production assembly/transport component CsgE n=1 Tax=Piscinibacter gummiphilus TaxID=946333 RepID=A0ABZ0CVI0_9BURK|nr:hypothetical protein [Piscinibacter gummiphilus]WOB06960.1 hypothetical protein RXV79_18780 [Piscinibacter gummiphilus]